MREAIRKSWNKLKQAEPGRRFREFHDYRKKRRQHHTSIWHIVPVGTGLLLLIGGLAIGWLPGPGGFIAIFGVALLATEFRFLARALDWSEIQFRRIWTHGWKQRSVPARIAVAFCAAAIAAGAAWAASQLLLS